MSASIRISQKLKTGIITFLLVSAMVIAHGLVVTIKKQSPTILVKASYHNGQALRHATVSVYFGKTNNYVIVEYNMTYIITVVKLFYLS